MKFIIVISVIIAVLFTLSCGDSAMSFAESEPGSTLSFTDGQPHDEKQCHDNMRNLATGMSMFYGMNNRYPDSIAELEVINPRLCELTCPSCNQPYLYSLSSSGEDYTLTCPLPVDPNHGFVESGYCCWPPDPSAWPGVCHNNMRSLATACAMFYGVYNRYPGELSELGTTGIYEHWDEPCPGCGELYDYFTDSLTTYQIHCPMPLDPTHGYIIDGVCYWPPDTTGSQESCRSNMSCLATGMSMFYGSYNRYPLELSELGTSGIMGNWDIPCPACGEIYHYSTDPSGSTYTIECPLPWDPAHGRIVDGIPSWN
jgi:hypothetical protein